MLAGIKEILIITTPGDRAAFENLLGNGGMLGISINYAIQEKPEGLAQAFTIGEQFISKENSCLILGDNIFYGEGMGRQLQDVSNLTGALIFGTEVADPSKYGVAEIDVHNEVISIEEKPIKPKSNLAIPGIYFFDHTVCSKAKLVHKSKRGEFEITSLLEMYRLNNQLILRKLLRGTTWMDCGTPDSLNDASNYIRAIEARQDLKIACLEEIAWRKNWITTNEILDMVTRSGSNTYNDYLLKMTSDGRLD